jgi:hypothetical protein
MADYLPGFESLQLTEIQIATTKNTLLCMSVVIRTQLLYKLNPYGQVVSVNRYAINMLRSGYLY